MNKIKLLPTPYIIYLYKLTINFINQHLIEKGLISDKNHIKTCGACIAKQNYYVSILGYRIEEVVELRGKIKTLIK